MALSLDGSLQYTFPLGPTVRSRRLSKKKGYLWGGPLYGADSCHRRRVNELSREPKIAEAHPERVGQQQVLRFQVAVHDARRETVEVPGVGGWGGGGGDSGGEWGGGGGGSEGGVRGE